MQPGEDRRRGDAQVPALLQITEDDVVESGPRVRALVVSRLEAMWEPVHVRLEQDKQGLQPIDPRMLEIGLRIVKEEMAAYRLTRPPMTAPQDDEEDLGAGVDRRALVEGHLAEIEQKLRDQGLAT